MVKNNVNFLVYSRLILEKICGLYVRVGVGSVCRSFGGVRRIGTCCDFRRGR